MKFERIFCDIYHLLVASWLYFAISVTYKEILYLKPVAHVPDTVALPVQNFFVTTTGTGGATALFLNKRFFYAC